MEKINKENKENNINDDYIIKFCENIIQLYNSLDKKNLFDIVINILTKFKFLIYINFIIWCLNC